MKKTLYTILFFLASKFCIAQNLVLNPGFEDTVCVNSFCFQPLDCSKFWYNPSPSLGTPDYSNAYCASPSTWCGPSLPNSFNSFGMGGAYMYAGGGNAREYLGGKLIESLGVGEKYKVIFYLRICSNMIYSVRNIGLYIGDSIYTSGPGLFSYTPQISNSINRPLIDTSIWYKVEGEFIASGGEKFITIGNFLNDANSFYDTLSSGSNVGSYYYFDNVSITKIEDTVITEFSFFPNPSNGNFTLNYNLGTLENGFLQIYNSIGQLVFTKNLNQNNGTENLSLLLAAGCYYLQLRTESELLHTEKLMIIK